MALCFFTSDLHGKISNYEKLIKAVKAESPAAVFLGGDLLPHQLRRIEYKGRHIADFTNEYLLPAIEECNSQMSPNAPEWFCILGNDDPRSEEEAFIKADQDGILHYTHARPTTFGEYTVLGYSFVPPSPFLLKDWEKYDVSRYADPGCIHPTEGHRSVPPDYDTEYSTIKKDLEELTHNIDTSKLLLLFHSPPYNCSLDRAALDGKMIDHVPLDVHVGSIAIRDFLVEKQAPLSLHGHIHESTRLTSCWKEKFGSCLAINGANDGPELSLVSFDPDDLSLVSRQLV